MNTLFLLFAACHLTLLAWTIAAAGRGTAPLWILRALLAGMAWDNLVQGTGVWVRDAPWFELAHVLRYFFHALLLPVLLLFGLWAMNAAGVATAGRSPLRWLCGCMTVAAIAWGLYHEVYMLELILESPLGVDKLVGSSDGPPLATISVNLALLAMGLAVWLLLVCSLQCVHLCRQRRYCSTGVGFCRRQLCRAGVCRLPAGHAAAICRRFPIGNNYIFASDPGPIMIGSVGKQEKYVCCS